MFGVQDGSVLSMNWGVQERRLLAPCLVCCRKCLMNEAGDHRERKEDSLMAKGAALCCPGKLGSVQTPASELASHLNQI